ncbi:MAG: DUF1015 domain-containing protein [Elusimicrobiota bacterium]
MVIIQPFKGIHYRTLRKDGIQNFICPPYDVIPVEERAWYRQVSPYNIVRLELPQGKNKYLTAQSIYKKWITKHVLEQDSSAAFYIYSQSFNNLTDSKIYTRYGIFVALKAEPFGKNVRPHEHTFKKYKNDRLRLYNATKLNISPVFGIFSDNNNRITKFIHSYCLKNQPVNDFYDKYHTRQRLWVVSSPELCDNISKMFKKTVVYIADGHHRYETGVMYAKNNRGIDSAQYCLVGLTAMEDPGLLVLPTHRMAVLKNKIELNKLFNELRTYFVFTPVNNFVPKKNITCIISYLGKKFSVKLTPKGIAEIRKMHPRASNIYRQLEVTVLHSLLIPKLPVHEVRYYKNFSDLSSDSKKYAGNKVFSIFLPSPRIKDVKAVANNSEFMPHKSTYFYPKLPTGMVMYSLKNSR